ncbi:AN1-type zinc finger protein 4 [Heterocephalus glaber]|uniref:AN1-type zinc finger protein 4 n=1 Tax=Heterocephalus glaber TaxID=10181 RepID=A0AAX6QGK4_HETGA|nr:AN1-type zinc finger protein 4 [Heterocephalus glaber]
MGQQCYITNNQPMFLSVKLRNNITPKRVPRVQPHPPNMRPSSDSSGVIPRPPLLPALTPLGLGTQGHLRPGSSQPQGTQHSTGNLATEDLQDPVLVIPPLKEHKPEAALRPAETEGNAVGAGCGAGAQGARRASVLSPSTPASPKAAAHSPWDSGSPGKPHREPRARDSRAALEPIVPSPGRGCGGVKVCSPGKRPDVISRVEGRDITEMANKATKDHVGRVSKAGLLASLARS